MEQKIHSYINEQVELEKFAGAVCAVNYQGKRIATTAVGNAVHTQDNQIPMDESTIFDLASVTKIYVATLMLRLISEGKCSLHSPISELLPGVEDIPTLKEKMKAITVYELLTHSSGIQAWFPFYTEQSRSVYDIIDADIHIKQADREVEYSDVNFMLLREMVEQLTQLPIVDAMQQYIAKPLKMKTLTYGPIDNVGVAATSWGNAIEQQMCKEYDTTDVPWRSNEAPICGEVNDGNCHYYFQGVSGHAGLFANIEDVLKLGELYLKGGEWDGKQLINKELIHQSMQPHEANRGLGWEVRSVFPEGCGHTGFTGTSLWVVPEKELTVALLTNRLHVQHPTSIQPIRAHVHDIVLQSMNNERGKRNE